MSKVDWSLAPEGATHKDPDEDGLWYKFDYVNNAVHYWSDQFNGSWRPSGIPDDYYDGSIDGMEIRQPPKPWSGPEDGLPPVGIECEVENPLEDGQWCKVKILAWDAECAVFQAGADYPYVYDGQELEGFRPLRTPEQLRETAIREFMDVVGIDCRVTASKAVDAGFKWEVA